MLLRLCSALLLLSFMGAQASAGTITKNTFASSTLNRDYDYSVYLPDGYADSGLRYPVVYLLHGSTGNENSWPVQGRVQPTLDRMIDSGAIPPVIVIMPSHTQSWWVDGNDEPAETAFINDVIPHVDATYRTIAAREGRVIGGLSAGGYGTTILIMKHPELFAAGAALSPAVYDPLPPSNSSANRHPVFQVDGKFDPDTWQRLNYTQYIDAYKAQDLVVPLYINTGDHDIFDIAYHAAVLFQRLREHQPKAVEYRVIDGDHEWMVWETTIGDALQYMLDRVSRPVGSGT